MRKEEAAPVGYQKCILCRATAPIKKSHIIPRFVFKWMIETGGTKFLRSAARPNKRVQDGIKAPLLCASCETKTSVLENRFAQEVFLPSVENRRFPQKMRKPYFDFTASVHHRIQAYYLKNSDKLNEISAVEKRLLLNSVFLLRRYLIGQRVSLFPSKVFLFPLGFGAPESFDAMPTNWHRYIRRYTEMDLFYSEGGGIFGSYFKVGPWLSFLLLKNESQPWIGGELLPRTCKPYGGATVLPPTILEFLKERAHRANAALDDISERQQEKIDNAIANADFFGKGRPMLDAIYEDVRIFGDRAFKQ